MVESPERTLYQFPISHYCEKTRWHLDAKGLPYVTKNLVPGVHRLVLRRSLGLRDATVPVLIDRGACVMNSSTIALHIENAYPDPPLLAREGPARTRALELEAYFDTHAGGEVRRYMYGQLFLARGRGARALFREYPLPVRLVGGAIGPLIERLISRAYTIHPQSVLRARMRVLDVFDRLERETSSDPSRYLVGESLTIADIAAAALLAPFLGPPNTPWAEGAGIETPAEVAELREQVRRRPGGQWVLRRYEFDRERRALA